PSNRIHNKTSMTKEKQVLVGRYYDKVKLQRALERLFPEENGAFELRMTNDNWVFYATREVTKDELV
ncbi:unnamed protein product, partial [Fusarium graminearum]